MRLSLFERRIYVATAAAVAGALANKGRMKPALAAHRAQEFAQAQVDEFRIREQAERLKLRRKVRS